MIRPEILILLAGALLLAGCERTDAGDSATEARARDVATTDAEPPDQSGAGAGASADAGVRREAGGDLAGIVPEMQDITVEGEPACALTVRYDDGDTQPVTWRGESCSRILVKLASADDLERIGQDAKLEEEPRDDLARMPGGRAVYIEGEHSSALYPRNVMGRVYEVPLAD